MMTPASHTQLLSETFDAATLERGRKVFATGNVGKIFVNYVSDETTLISATVIGSNMERYETSIEIEVRKGGLAFADANCTCPVEVDCKHAAAVMMAWNRKPNSSVNMATTPSTPQALPSISKDIRSWIGQLAAQENRAPVSAKKDKFVGYILNQSFENKWYLEVSTLSIPKNGSPRFSKPQVNIAKDSSPPKYVTTEDVSLARRFPDMCELGNYYSRPSGMDLSLGFGFEALRDTIATGRAYLDQSTKPLVWGDKVKGQLVWQSEGQMLQLVLINARDKKKSPLVLIPTTPLVWMDFENGMLGELALPMEAYQANLLLEMPPLPKDSVEIVHDMLTDSMRALLPPMPLKRQVARETAFFRPTFKIGKRNLSAQASRLPNQNRRYNNWQYIDAEFLVGEAYFDLAGQNIKPMIGEIDVMRLDGDKIMRYSRDLAAERAMVSGLLKLGPSRLSERHDYRVSDSVGTLLGFPVETPLSAAVALWQRLLPAISALGWHIELDDDAGVVIDRIDAGSLLNLELVAANSGGNTPSSEQKIDWFEAEVGARINGTQVDLAPFIMNWLRAVKPGERYARLEALSTMPKGSGAILIPTSDGKLVSLDPADLKPVLEALLALFSPREIDEGNGKIQAARLAEVAEIEALNGAGWRDGSHASRLASVLQDWSSTGDIALPDGFKADLRPYQQMGVKWMAMLWEAQMGGCLADDMGLGKTIQTLAWLSILKSTARLTKPVLIISPTSVVPNWQAEITRFAPELSVLNYTGSDRGEKIGAFESVDLVLTSYALLQRDIETLSATNWSVAVLDEAQAIRNPMTAVSKAARKLNATQRLALSGTPVENHLGDLWSLMTYLNPGLCGDQKQFGTDFRKPIELDNSLNARKRLSRRIKPFMLRRTRDEVVKDLPDRTEQSELITLSKTQFDLYEATRSAMQTRVRDALQAKGLNQSSIVILDALLKLRQCCCDPRLIASAPKAAKEGGSAKLDRLIEMLVELKEEGRKVLVFSQFVTMLELTRERIVAAGLSFEWLTGSTKDRATPVERFQNGEADLFLISLKAGGAGLNLTAADTVIIFDPWWNPAAEAQAIGRAHRIGQQRPVFVHRMIASGTIEEKMLALQSRKQDIANAIWDADADTAGGVLAGLAAEDVLGLFN